MATTYLYRDATGDVGVQKATISTWVKRSNVKVSNNIFTFVVIQQIMIKLFFI